MKFDPSKYKYVIHTRKDGCKEVIALSTYAKKTVKGVAKCAPEDAFNEENGKKLAAARCNVRVSSLRVKRARHKFHEAMAILDAAKEYYRDMAVYLEESKDAYALAVSDCTDLEKTM